MADSKNRHLAAYAKRMKNIRNEYRMSQEKFAETLEISLSTYKKIESGQMGVSTDILKKVKHKFNVSSDYILYGDCENTEDVIDVVYNCSEMDKMKIFLKLSEQLGKCTNEKDTYTGR